MNLPTIDQIILIHDRMIEAGRLKNPEKNTRGMFPTGRGTLDSIIELSEWIEDEWDYTNFIQVVSQVYDGIIRLHPFLEGNKRTAIVVAFEICIMNGHYLIKINTKEEVKFATDIAATTRDDMGLDEINKYFSKRVITVFEYAVKHLWQTKVSCPRCGAVLYLGQRKCSCGVTQLITALSFKGQVDSYEYSLSIREADIISRSYKYQRLLR